MAEVIGGVLSGAAGGAATGSALGPYGALVGGAIGGIMGGVKANKANDAQQIPGTDAGEIARMAELKRTVKELSEGNDPLTKLNIRENQKSGREAMNNIARVTAGDVGSTISAFQKAQGAVQTGNARAVAGAAERIPYFDNAQGGLLTRIADRKLQLQLLNRAQRTGEDAQARTDGNVSGQALMGAIGGGLDFLGGSGSSSGSSGLKMSSNAGSSLDASSLSGPLNTGYTQGIPTATGGSIGG